MEMWDLLGGILRPTWEVLLDMISSSFPVGRG